jgi:hypothetical protein
LEGKALHKRSQPNPGQETLSKTVVTRKESQACSIRKIEFIKQATDMGVYGAYRDAQLIGNLLISHAPTNIPQYFNLARGEIRERMAWLGGLPDTLS